MAEPLRVVHVGSLDAEIREVDAAAPAAARGEIVDWIRERISRAPAGEAE